METICAFLALRAGDSPVTGEFPAQRPVTRSFDVFFHLHPNKRLSKPSWGWRFETQWRSLWRHCNGFVTPHFCCVEPHFSRLIKSIRFYNENISAIILLYQNGIILSYADSSQHYIALKYYLVYSLPDFVWMKRIFQCRSTAIVASSIVILNFVGHFFLKRFVPLNKFETYGRYGNLQYKRQVAVKHCF